MARIKAARLERLAEIQAELKAHAAKVDPLVREAAQIRAEAEADLTATGKPNAKRGAFVLAWDEKKISVKWKDEFIRVASADAAAELSKEAGTKKLFVIRPAA